MSINISRKGRLFAKIESGTYADAAVTFAPTDACRHIDVEFTHDPFMRVLSTEKKTSPGGLNFFDRRVTSGWNLKTALLRPSGVLNTIPECSVFLEASFGQKTNITLATTVGIPALVAALAAAGSGLVENGAHEYYYTFVDGTGETKVSALATVTVTDKTTNGKVALSSVSVGPAGVTARKIYRTATGQTGVANAKLLTTLADNTTTIFTDNVADASLTTSAPLTDTSAILTDKKTLLLSSVTGLAVNQGIACTRAGVIYIRRIKALTGSLVTLDSALPTAAAFADVAKGCITYQLTTDLAVSLALFHVQTAIRRLMLGNGADKLQLSFKANEEVQLSASGPSQQQLTAALPASPGSFTTVGGNPPSCLIGDLWIGDAAYLHKDATFDITNGLVTRNVEAGNNGLATEVYRSGRRVVTFSLNAFAETEATLYDLAVAGTLTPVVRQVGRTSGNIIAVCMPSVDFKVPGEDDGDKETTWSFKATARETADGNNDEAILVLA
jgi:hypothetical protein